MSKISDATDRNNARLDRVDAALAGISGDVKGLKDLITQIQNSPGELTPEDQAALDALEGRVDALAVKTEALDAETPPVG